MRDTLFISHATPEDNDFAIWLASRLEMLGYKTWVDKKHLLGGEKLWSTIQNVIKNDAIKLLIVYSRNILTKDGNLKDGIEKEFTYAESIASQENMKDFIIPLHIDNSQYNDFIGSNRLNHISFEQNWAIGLKQLLKKLEKDNIPQMIDIRESSFSEWYENEYVSNCSIIPKKELFYSSWWEIASMPQRFYMYQFDNLTQAIAIRNININIPINLQSNVLSTFDNNLNFIIERDGEQFHIVPKATYSFSINEILCGFESSNFPKHKDAENHFKRLLYCTITELFLQKQRKKVKLANNKFAFFLSKNNEKKQIHFSYPSSSIKRLKRISIWGEFEQIGFWHYAISPQVVLFPIIGFSLKSHIVFTTDGVQLITDDKKVHSYRRRKGKRYFNEGWRDWFVAFLQGLKDINDEIKIKISSNGEYLKMKQYPKYFWSEVGYNDPKPIMDIDKVENYTKEFEENEDIE
jgi:hypothetical protein